MTNVPARSAENDPPSGNFVSRTLVTALAAVVIDTLGADSWAPWWRLLSGVIVIIVLVIPAYRWVTRSLGQCCA